MTPDEINAAIAELCGWKYVRIDNSCRNVRDDWPSGKRVGSDKFWSVPDYYHSLDACAEFERTMTTHEYQSAYLGYLRHTNTHPTSSFQLCTVSAPQRCEAFLKVKGLWK